VTAKGRPRRVLHVLASLDQRYGGPLRAVLDLCAAGESLGVHSEIVGLGELNVPDNPFPAGRIHSLPAAGPWRYSSQLRPWLRANLGRFHGVVLHGLWLYPNWAAALECQAARKPYACFPHGMLEPWAVYGQGLLKAAKKLVYWAFRERRVCQSACHILYTTGRERDLAAGLVTLRPASSILAPFGFSPDIPPRVNPVRSELLQPAGTRLALFLGRIHPKKNPALLVRAWAAARMPSEWRLVIAGSGDPACVEETQALARTLGIAGSVVFPGFVSGDDRAYLLQRADWFLLPSSQENFGIAVLEAIEQGCAVAISDSVYLSEAFRPESVVLPVAASAWTAFFRTRMRDRAWRDETAEKDRRHLLGRFSAEQVSREWSHTWLRLFPGEAA
jgi:glycosyltransferase involved in cell wall biosynthesis